MTHAQRIRFAAWTDTQNDTADILIPGTAEDEGRECMRHGTEVRKALMGSVRVGAGAGGWDWDCEWDWDCICVWGRIRCGK